MRRDIKTVGTAITFLFPTLVLAGQMLLEYQAEMEISGQAILRFFIRGRGIGEGMSRANTSVIASEQRASRYLLRDDLLFGWLTAGLHSIAPEFRRIMA